MERKSKKIEKREKQEIEIRSVENVLKSESKKSFFIFLLACIILGLLLGTMPKFFTGKNVESNDGEVITQTTNLDNCNMSESATEENCISTENFTNESAYDTSDAGDMGDIVPDYQEFNATENQTDEAYRVNESSNSNLTSNKASESNYKISIGYGSSNDVNLTIWDDTEIADRIEISGDNVYFYANYTNASSGLAIGDGNCTIRFQNYTGSYGDWFDMRFNSTYNRFQYNRTFNYKGNYSFEVNCSNFSYYAINLTDLFIIINSIPVISKQRESNYINFDGDNENHDTWQCIEDILCYYNLSANTTDADINDVLSYSVILENTTLTNYNLCATTGLLTINITHDNYTGLKEIRLKAVDNEDPLGASALLEVNIATVNDAPVFHNLMDEQFNITERFEKIITVTDEENNVPFKLNITFMNCTTAPWSSRNSTNCTLFTESQYSFNETTGVLNISFIPSKDDVGFYVSINFSVWDSGNTVLPYNASTSKVVSYEVLNINSPPEFVYVCDNERNATEESEFTCMINATDIDELNNLVFATNYSWFTFNNSANIISINITSVGMNVSAIVNFTPDDLQVGNWSVEIIVNDTNGGSDITNNWFFINNTEDFVYLDEISNVTIYENKTIFVNATDNDLLVLDKEIKNETLSFASNISWVYVSRNYTTLNYTTARILIDFNTAPEGNTTVKINVTDSVGNVAERNFTIQKLVENPFVWNQSNYIFVVYEDNSTYLNLSEYGYDPDVNDTTTFSYTTDTTFPSFPSDISNGIINFTSEDEDVGQHLLIINAYDGKLSNQSQFNFTIFNINDWPQLLSLSVTNATKDTNWNINTTEDNQVEILLDIVDYDFKIPSNQVDFYNESLNVSLVIQGNNLRLFNFSLVEGFPSRATGFSKYIAVFTPNKTDVGVYNVTINVIDNSSESDTRGFNLTIFEKAHAPVLSEVGDQIKAIDEILYIDFDANDTEDGNEATPGSNLTYSIENLTTNGNFLVINSTNGIINLTLNQSHAGVWDYNVSVNDSSGLIDSQTLRLTVYDYPQVVYPALDYEFSLKENVSSELVFAFNHRVGVTLNDSLNYTVYINGKLKNNSLAYGNGENSTIYIMPDFTDETTCTGKVNFTINISNPKLSKIFDWNITINHTNYPLTLFGVIPDSSGIGSVTINLTKYFTDADAIDSCVKQIVGYSYKLTEGTASGGIISVSIINTTNAGEASITFSASAASSSAVYNITADEYEGSDYNNTILNKVGSNNFTIDIEIINPRVVTTTVTRTELAIIQLILPEPVSADIDDRIILPIKVVNEGKVDLKEIRLFSVIAKDGKLAYDITSVFDTNFIELLEPGQSKDVNLTVNVATKYKGLYEITINATVKTPVLNDWGKIYLEVKEGLKIEKRILFLEELIASNPECIEIKEMVNEARVFLDNNNLKAAEAKIEEAINACNQAISQPPIPKVVKPTYEKLINYVVLSSLLALGMGIMYYYFRRMRV